MTYAHDAHCNTTHTAGPQACPPARTGGEPHLIPTITDRGFTHMPAIESSYGGTVHVRTYESSNASGPYLWLTFQGTDEAASLSAHLTVEDALRLADQIHYLASNHYQLREDRDA